MNEYDGIEPVNIGVEYDYTILDIAKMVARVTGFNGRIIFDETKPDGVMRKLLDSSKITNFGWKPQLSLEDGLRQTYQWFMEQYG